MNGKSHKLIIYTNNPLRHVVIKLEPEMSRKIKILQEYSHSHVLFSVFLVYLKTYFTFFLMKVYSTANQNRTRCV